MIETFVEAYPWDLIPPEADSLLARLRGEAGVTGLAVWAAAAPQRTLRIRDWRPRVFRSRGGLYFQPRRDRYEHGRCRPLVSRWTHEGERFGRAAAACERNGLKLRLLISAASTGRLAEHYPEFASCNVLGVESTRNLCLVNPDVQEYLIALVSDVAEQFSPAGIVLTDYSVGWLEAFDPDLENGFLGAADRGLLGLCFCQSCQQQAEEAGVDSFAAAEYVSALLHASLGDDKSTLAAGKPKPLEPDGKSKAALDVVGTPYSPLAEKTPPRDGRPAQLPDAVGTGDPLSRVNAANGPLAEYRRFQQERLNGLLRSLVQSCNAELLLSRDVASPHSSLLTPLLSRVREPADLDKALAPKAKRNEASLSLSLAQGDRGPELVSLVHRAAEMGYVGLHLSHFGILSDSMLPTLKQAIRFARRTAE